MQPAAFRLITGDMMTEPIVKIYEDLSVAEHVRQQLIASGFSTDDVELTPLYDEAGPMEGNFWVGSGGAAGKGLSGMLGPKGGTDETVYGPDYSHPKQHSSFVLKVEPQDDMQRDRAAAVLSQTGATDIGRRY
jgi:hypothetical protein